MDIPAELARQEVRLEAIVAAKAEIERRATERHAAEQAAYEAKVAAREEKSRRRASALEAGYRLHRREDGRPIK